MRIVFDDSSKTTTGVALNDKLMIGPTIQPTLWAILVRFRGAKIVITADIEKMYRQVIVAPDDCDYRRVLWRENPNQQIRHYRLSRVTVGLACSAYLALRSLQQLARDDADGATTQHILRDFYVHDLLSGSPETQSARKLKADLINVLEKGCFSLRKWRSHAPRLCDGVNSDAATELYRNDTSAANILG